MVKKLNYKDYSLKAKLQNFEEIERILEMLGAHYIGQDRQTDTYFETPRGKLKLRQGSIENLIAHYERKMINGLERTDNYRYDQKPDITVMNDLFRNHKVIGVIRKLRKIYKIDNVKIHLDKTEEGELFIEIEAIDEFDEFTETGLLQQCLEIKEKLGISDKQLIKSGYLKTQ